MKKKKKFFLEYIKEKYDPEIAGRVIKRLEKLENPTEQEMSIILKEERDVFSQKRCGSIYKLGEMCA